ncbi:MAG: hypothetical protein Q9185_005582 [Variospora sp. 1 TL-2023]
MTTNVTPLSEYITLISNDGFEFIIKRDAANVAGTIKKMLDPTIQVGLSSTPTNNLYHPFNVTTDTFIPFQSNNSGVVIEKLCEYLYYNLKHKDAKDVPDMEIPPSLCLELLVAADYFDGMCVCLLGERG